MLPGQGRHDTRRVCPAWEPDPAFPRPLSPEADGDNTHLPGRREALGGGEVGQGVLFPGHLQRLAREIPEHRGQGGVGSASRAVAGCSEAGGMGPRPGNASHSKVHRASCLSTPVSSRPGQGSPQPATKVLTFPPLPPTTFFNHLDRPAFSRTIRAEQGTRVPPGHVMASPSHGTTRIPHPPRAPPQPLRVPPSSGALGLPQFRGPKTSRRVANRRTHGG